MARRKLILICQSGGEFETNDDRTLSYIGGEANAININDETQFDDLKLKLAEMCNLEYNSVSIKYFLPGNKRNLITLKNDKDLTRLIDFHGNSVTAEIFVLGTKGFNRDALNMYANRESDIKLAETVNRVVEPIATTKSTPVKASKSTPVKAAKATPVKAAKATPVKVAKRVGRKIRASAYNTRATRANPADSVKAADASARSPTPTPATPDSTPSSSDFGGASSDVGGDEDSDYAPRSNVAAVAIRDGPTKIDPSCTPADTVKKRRRTASWKFGANGPIIVSVADDVQERSPKRIRQSRSSVSGSDDVGQKQNTTPRERSPKRKRKCRSFVAVVDEIEQKQVTAPRERRIEGAREQLQESHKEAYDKLPRFCEKMVETNPGSFAKITTNNNKRFQCLFISFHATIHGFRNICRPLLFLEATSFTSVYEESLLMAIALDGDDGFFPVAFAIVDVENDDNWHWFLEQLKSALSTSESITFVSDREKNLKKTVIEIFENAHHGYSMYHLIESLKENLEGPFHGDGKGALPGKFVDAAHAIRLSGFTKFTEQIKRISSEAYNRVMQIETEHWTSLLFKGEAYNHIMQDVGEPYAKLMQDMEDSSMIQKIEALIGMTSELINNRRMDSSEWSAKLTPSKEKKLQEEILKVRGLKVFISSDTLFEVHDDSVYVVNINNLECSCLEWKRSGLPCRHAIAVFKRINRSVYDYCPKSFTVDTFRLTYSESINPVPGIDAPVEKEEADSDAPRVIPPSPAQTPSQQKKQRNKTEEAKKRTVICSKCKEAGHNKSSCKTGKVQPCEVDNAGSSHGNSKDGEVQPCEVDSASLSHGNPDTAEQQPSKVDNDADLSEGNPGALEEQPSEVGNTGCEVGNTDCEVDNADSSNGEAVEVESCELGNTGSKVDNAGSSDGNPKAVEVLPCEMADTGSEVDNAGLSQDYPAAVEVQSGKVADAGSEVANAGLSQDHPAAVEVQPGKVTDAGSEVANAGLSQDHPTAVEVQPCTVPDTGSKVDSAGLRQDHPSPAPAPAAVEVQPCEVDYVGTGQGNP